MLKSLPCLACGLPLSSSRAHPVHAPGYRNKKKGKSDENIPSIIMKHANSSAPLRVSSTWLGGIAWCCNFASSSGFYHPSSILLISFRWHLSACTSQRQALEHCEDRVPLVEKKSGALPTSRDDVKVHKCATCFRVFRSRCGLRDMVLHHHTASAALLGSVGVLASRHGTPY
jgi:hypothetical protein